jgi:hypothetical protein
VAGQCWPIGLNFSGGRGISAFVRAACAIDRTCWLVALVPFVVGSGWRVVPMLRQRSAPLGQGLRAGRSRSVPIGSLGAGSSSTSKIERSALSARWGES